MPKITAKSVIPAVPAAARIDIRYGGTPEQVERESIDIARAYITTLDKGKSLLYLNTLSPDAEFSCLFGDYRKQLRSETQRERFRSETMEPDAIYVRRQLFEEMVAEQRLRVLIINSFDYASMTMRGRRRIFEVLKYLRDFMRLHIILYMRFEPRRDVPGVASDLAWLASSVSSMERPVVVARRSARVRDRQSFASESGLETIDTLTELPYLTLGTGTRHDGRPAPDADQPTRMEIFSLDRGLRKILEDASHAKTPLPELPITKIPTPQEPQKKVKAKKLTEEKPLEGNSIEKKPERVEAADEGVERTDERVEAADERVEAADERVEAAKPKAPLIDRPSLTHNDLPTEKTDTPSPLCVTRPGPSPNLVYLNDGYDDNPPLDLTDPEEREFLEAESWKTYRYGR